MRSLLLLGVLVCARAAQVEECSKLGFTESLVCSSCDKLAAMVPDEALEADCRSCCQEGNASDSGKFDSGRLEVCK